MASPSKINNSLSQTTTYSGSDISVIAYRNTDSPALLFLKGQLNQEIKLLDSNIKNSERDLENIPIATTFARNEIEQQWDQFYSKDVFATGLNPDSVGTRELPSGEIVPVFERAKENWEGVVENRYNKLDSLQSERIQRTQERIESLQRQKNEKEEELKKIQASQIFDLGSIHTISYSSFREKFAVRSLGMVAAKGYTHGPRTIAGTMVFNVLQSHELYSLASPVSSAAKGDEVKGSRHPGSAMLDQIDPFNILLLFANEFGVYSSLHLFDVTISTEGQSMSIDEVITQNTMNFYALEMLPMTSLGNAFESTNQMIAEIINETKNEKAAQDKNYKYAPIKAPTFDSILSTSSVQTQQEIDDLLKSTRGLF